MSIATLSAAAHRWAASRRVCILGCSSDAEGKPTDEVRALIKAWEDLHLNTVIVNWEELTDVPAAAAVLPLLLWGYERSPSTYARFVHTIRALLTAGHQPASDLRAMLWISHKGFLIELAEAGVPTVPTVLIRAGDFDKSTLRDAYSALRCMDAELVRDAPCGGGSAWFVAKPAVGGGGDGVERITEHDSQAEDEVLALLRSGRDMLLQPFLWRVQHRGELAFVFVNGELLHAVCKEPAGWGGGSVECATDQASPGDADASLGADIRQHACPSQPVTRLDSPPAAAEAIARQALEVATRRHATPGEPLYLARVDLLPALPLGSELDPVAGSADDSHIDVCGGFESVHWLVSELEISWPHLFLRAAAAGEAVAAGVVARGLLRHLRRQGGPKMTDASGDELAREHRDTRRQPPRPRSRPRSRSPGPGGATVSLP